MPNRLDEIDPATPEFNAAADPNPPKEPKTPELRHDPPVVAPTPGGTAQFRPPPVAEVAREELDGPARDAVEQARDRMDRGESETGDPLLTEAFDRAGWSSPEIEEVRRDAENPPHLDLEPEWDEQARRDYERFQMDQLRDRAAERDRDAETPGAGYDDVLRGLTAEFEAAHEGPEPDGHQHDGQQHDGHQHDGGDHER